MYMEFFGLREHPFRLTSDPKFLFLTESHARVKAYIEYALHIQDSIIVVTGEIGSGKTTLLHDALNNLGRDTVVARIHQTRLTEVEFLQSILVEFGYRLFSPNKVELLDKLSTFFREKYAEGKKVILIIDEAQNLSKDILEEIRLLSDIQDGNDKILNVILVGQPELNSTLAAPDLEQLVQRVRLRFHIRALNEQETFDYINHRLAIAGAYHDNVCFLPEATPLIHEYSGGRPRLINILGDYALTTAFVDEVREIGADIILRAVKELQWKPYAQRFNQQFRAEQDWNVTPEDNQKLVITLRGKMSGVYLVNKEYVHIGRHVSNDIQINDKKASRHHAQVLNNSGEAYLRDLNSTNGTFVNSQPVDIMMLRHGSKFSIGEYEFQYLKGDLDGVEEDTFGDENSNVLAYKPPVGSSNK